MKKEIIVVRLDKDTKNIAEDKAKALGLSVSAYLRMLIIKR